MSSPLDRPRSAPVTRKSLGALNYITRASNRFTTSSQQKDDSKNVKVRSSERFETNFFGAPLPKDPNDLPPFIYEAMKHIEKYDIDTEGIFRITADYSLIEEATNEIARNNGHCDFTKYKSYHLAAGILKLYFRKLPECLFTSELYEDFIAASAIENKVERLQAIQGVLMRLPFHVLEVIKMFMLFLNRVTQRQAYNRMAPDNLGTVFAPALLKSSRVKTQQEVVHDTKFATSLIVTLIGQADEIFGLEINVSDVPNMMTSRRSKRVELETTNKLVKLNVLEAQDDCGIEEADSPTKTRSIVRKSARWGGSGGDRKNIKSMSFT
jgi:hypothetical protein